MSLPDEQQNAKPEPQEAGSAPRGPVVTLTFTDTGEGPNHTGKKEIVRINLPPHPPAKPTGGPK